MDQYQLRFDPRDTYSWVAVRYYKDQKALDTELFEVRFVQGAYHACFPQPGIGPILTAEDLQETANFINGLSKPRPVAP